MKRVISFLSIGAVLTLGLAGCGGGGSSSSAHPAKQGSAHVSIRWPKKRGPVIPYGTAAISLQVFTGPRASTSMPIQPSTLVPVPSSSQGGTSSVTLVDLPAQQLYIYATAYPSYDSATKTPSGNPIASGYQLVNIAAGSQADFSITMASSVDHYLLTVSPISGGSATTLKAKTGQSSAPISVDIGGTYSIELHPVDVNEVPVVLSTVASTDNITLSSSSSVDLVGAVTAQSKDKGGSPDTSTTALLRVKDLLPGKQIQVSYEDSDNLVRQFTFPIQINSLASSGLTWSTALNFFSPGAIPGASILNDLDVSTGRLYGLASAGLKSTLVGTVSGSSTLGAVGTAVNDPYCTSNFTGRIGAYFTGSASLGFAAPSIIGSYSTTTGLSSPATTKPYAIQDIVAGPGSLDWILSYKTSTLLSGTSQLGKESAGPYSIPISSAKSIAVGCEFLSTGTLTDTVFLSTYDPTSGAGTGSLQRVDLLSGTPSADSGFAGAVGSYVQNAIDISTDVSGWNGSDDLLYTLDVISNVIWVSNIYGTQITKIALPADGKTFQRLKVANRTIYLLYQDKTSATKIAVFSPVTPPRINRSRNRLF